MSDRCRQEAQGATSWKVNFYIDENSRKKALYQRGNPKANLQYYDAPQEHFALIKNKLRDNDSARNVFPDLKVVDVSVNEREITFEISGENYEALQPLPREGTLSSEQFNAIERTCNQAAEHAGNVKWLLRYWEADSLFLYKKDFKWHALYARYHHAAPWSEDWENDEFKNWHRPELGRKPNYCNGKGKNWGYATRSHDLTAKNLLLAELRKRATISPSQADGVIPTPSQDNSEAAISQEPPHPARIPPAQDPEKPESLAATSEAHGAASSASARRNETRQIFPNSTKGKYKLAVIALAITLVAGALFRYLQPEPGPSVRITAPQEIPWPPSNPKLHELAFSYVTKNVSWNNLTFQLKLPNGTLINPKSKDGSSVVFDVLSESITADATNLITLVIKDRHGKQLNAHEVTVTRPAPPNPPPPPPIPTRISLDTSRIALTNKNYSTQIYARVEYKIPITVTPSNLTPSLDPHAHPMKLAKEGGDWILTIPGLTQGTYTIGIALGDKPTQTITNVPITVVENKPTKINFTNITTIHERGHKDKYRFEVLATDEDVFDEAIINLSVKRASGEKMYCTTGPSKITNGHKFPYEMECANNSEQVENIVAQFGNVKTTNSFRWRLPGVSVKAQDFSWKADEQPPKLVFTCTPTNVNWSDLKFRIIGKITNDIPKPTDSQFKVEFQLGTDSVSAGASQTFKLTITLNNREIAAHTVEVTRKTASPPPSISHPRLEFDPTKLTNVYARITQEIPINISHIDSNLLSNLEVTLEEKPQWLRIKISDGLYSLVASNPPNAGLFDYQVKLASSRFKTNWTYANNVLVKENQPTRFEFRNTTNQHSQNASNAGNHQTWEIELNDPDVFECAATNFTVRRSNIPLKWKQESDSNPIRFRFEIAAPNPLIATEILNVQLGEIREELELQWPISGRLIGETNASEKVNCLNLVKAFQDSFGGSDLETKKRRRDSLDALLQHLFLRGQLFKNYHDALSKFKDANPYLDQLEVKSFNSARVKKWYPSKSKGCPPELEEMEMPGLLEAIRRKNEEK